MSYEHPEDGGTNGVRTRISVICSFGRDIHAPGPVTLEIEGNIAETPGFEEVNDIFP